MLSICIFEGNSGDMSVEVGIGSPLVNLELAGEDVVAGLALHLLTHTFYYL
jgi:hypothetical protein